MVLIFFPAALLKAIEYLHFILSFSMIVVVTFPSNNVNMILPLGGIKGPIFMWVFPFQHEILSLLTVGDNLSFFMSM